MIKLRKCLKNIIPMAMLSTVMLSTIALGSTLAEQPQNISIETGQELKFVIFSINSADATLIIFPTGKTMMVDSGTENMNIARVMPFLQRHGIDHLDYYVDTHGHKDHYGGRAPMTAAGIIDENTKTWNKFLDDGTPAKHAQVYYNSTDEGPKELFYESQFQMEGTHWFISSREDVEFFDTGNANVNSLSFRMEFNGFTYSHGGDEARLSMNRYLADHPDLVEVDVRNTAHHMRGPINKDYFVATNADLWVISNMAGMSANKDTYNLLLDTVVELEGIEGNDKEHEVVITGDVGHIIIRASGEGEWSYETCLDYNNCVFDYINDNPTGWQPANIAPTVEISSAVEEVTEGESISLTSAVTDENVEQLIYSWLQLAGGPTVTIADTSIANISFTAPDVSNETQIEMELTVSDGEFSDSATVQVMIKDKVVATEAPSDNSSEGGGGSFFYLISLLLGSLLLRKDKPLKPALGNAWAP